MSPSNAPVQSPELKDLLTRLAASIDRIPVGRTHYVTILLIAAGMFFDILESNSVGLAGSAIIASFGITKTQLALITSVTFIGLTLGAWVGGAIADLRGRKFSLMLNLVVYTVGGLVCAFAPNYEVFIAARLIVGLGLGGELAVGIALISEIMPTKHRASAVASLNMFSGGLGNLVAPLYASLVLVVLGDVFGGPEQSWRWLFGLLVIPVLLVLVIRRSMPESPRYLLSRGDVHAANDSLLKLARGRVPAGEIVIRTTPQLNTQAIHTIADRVRLSEIFRGGLLRRTVTSGGTYFLLVGVQISLLTLMPTFLVARGSTVGQSLMYTLVMQIGSLLGTVCAATVTHRFSRRKVMIVGAVLGCLDAFAFGLFAQTDLQIVLFGAIFQFFNLLLTTTLWTWASELYPTRVRGFGVSFVKGMGSIGPIVMPPVIAMIFDEGDLVAVFTTLAVMYAFIVLFSFLGVETKGKTLEEANEAQGVVDAR